MQCFRPLFQKCDGLFPGHYLPMFGPVSVSLPIQSTNVVVHGVAIITYRPLINIQTSLSMVSMSRLQSEHFSALIAPSV